MHTRLTSSLREHAYAVDLKPAIPSSTPEVHTCGPVHSNPDLRFSSQDQEVAFEPAANHSFWYMNDPNNSPIYDADTYEQAINIPNLDALANCFRSS